MKCDICRERTAVIFVQQVSRGSSIELHLCEQCARERGYKIQDNRIDISLGGLFSGVLSNSDRGREGAQTCPGCGTTLDELRKKRRVGCALCYQEFRGEITALMRSEGFTPGFDGPLPERLEAFKTLSPNPENLKKELQRAIESEDYELAAYYRDRIRALGGNA